MAPREVEPPVTPGRGRAPAGSVARGARSAASATSRPDLVAPTPRSRADARRCSRSGRAPSARHRVDRRLEDPAERAPPARVRAAEDPRASGSNRTTGAQSATRIGEDQPGLGRHQGVGRRDRVGRCEREPRPASAPSPRRRPWPRGPARPRPGRRAQRRARRSGPPAVLEHRRRVVAHVQGQVEGGVGAARDPAVPGGHERVEGQCRRKAGQVRTSIPPRSTQAGTPFRCSCGPASRRGASGRARLADASPAAAGRSRGRGADG